MVVNGSSLWLILVTYSFHILFSLRLFSSMLQQEQCHLVWIYIFSSKILFYRHLKKGLTSRKSVSLMNCMSSAGTNRFLTNR